MGLLCVFLLCVLLSCPDDRRFEEAVLSLCGVSEPEELEGQVLEHYQHLYEHPLRINQDSPSRLISSGLFTRYQLSSLEDYRRSNGDVLSVMELSSIDGFGPSFASAASVFLTFEPSRTGPDTCYIDADVRTAWKSTLSYGTRIKVYDGSHGTLSASYNSPYTSSDTWTGSAMAYGRGHLGKVVLGNMNLRLGQGALMWSGMSLSGAGSSDAFVRNPTFLSPTHSFSGTSSLRGCGADFSFSRHTITVFAAKNLYGANCSCWGRNFQAGVSALYADGSFLASADLRACVRHTDIFCEIVSSGAFIGGVRFNPSYGNSYGIVFRHYPSDYENPYSGALRAFSSCRNESGATLGWKYSKGKSGGTLTADLCIRQQSEEKSSVAPAAQLKLLAANNINIYKELYLRTRISYRHRNSSLAQRLDLRCDLVRDAPLLYSAWRLNVLKGRSTACLTSLDNGVKLSNVSAYLCCGLFVVDNWDDRIYAWQRDAPCSFSIPAYYGRGVWASLYVKWKIRKSGLYLRCSTVRYPFVQAAGVSERKAAEEIKLQYSTSLGF